MNARERRRTLNIRVLIIFVVLAVLLSGGTHYLHGFQVKRNADALLAQADRAESEQDMKRFKEYLGRYVSFRPDDLDAASRYGLFLERNAQNLRDKYEAFLQLDSVLRRDPNKDREEVRRRAAELAISLNRPLDARAHLERLLEIKPEDPELEDLMGRCEVESKHFDKARAAFESSLRGDSKRLTTAFELAKLLRSPLNPAPELDKAADADRVLDAVVEASPDSFNARMVRCRYYQTVGNLDAADRDLAYAREKLAPDNVEVLLSSAELAEARRHYDEARKHLERGRTKFPKDSRFSLALARIELRAGSEHRTLAADQLKIALKTAPEDIQTQWTYADLFIDAGEMVEAQKVVDRLNTMGTPASALEFLQARLLAAAGKTGEAVAVLERCRAGGTVREGMAFLNRKMNLLLGSWYERLGNPDQELAAYERVLSEDPSSTQARAGKATALSRLGRVDDALTIYRSLFPDVPALRLNAVRLMVTRDLRLAQEQRNLGEAERMLRGAPSDVKARPEYRLLLIDLYAVSGRWPEAVAEAEAACKEFPKESRYWLARAALAERAPKPDRAKAVAIIDEAEKHLGDTAELRLVRGIRASELPLAEARPILLKLEQGTDAYSRVERSRLEAGLATAYFRLGDNKEAERLMALAVIQTPEDLGVRQQFFDIAVMVGDSEAAAKQVDELHRVEGDEGVLWRYEQAAICVQAAHKGDTAALVEARQQLTEVANRRPNWSRRLVLEGEIAEMEGRTDLALEDYQKAIDRGERSQRVVRRAVQFLATRRRTEEARHLLQKVLEQSPPGAGDLNRMLVEVSLPDTDSKQRSLEMVRAAVSPESKEYRDFLWLGQVLASLGEKKEAEAAIRKAVSMRESSPDVWIALVVFLSESDRKDEARAELRQAQTKLPEALQPTVTARCREALGDAQGAEGLYVDMVKSHPNDPAVKHQVAAFYLRSNQAAKAEPHLRSLATGDGPDSTWARRTLALSLAVSGDYQKTREALELLEKNLVGNYSGPEDQRARAMVLALRPGDRRASIQALEESFVRVKPTPQEQFLLAQLYESDRNWTKASEKLLELIASKQGKTPEIVAFYIRALLRHDRVSDARVLMSDLETMDPNSARTVGLKARLLTEENKGDEAGRLLKDFARKEFAAKKDPQTLSRFASLLADLGRPAEAEELYRLNVAETEKTRPESVLGLASFLASHGKLGEALDLCERVSDRCSPELVAVVAVGSLRLAKATDADRKRVQTWLDEMIRKKPDSVNLLVARADLLDACGEYDASVRVYRDLLERNPRNVLALNNLAWLLAIHDNKGEEARKLIDRAIELAGPGGDLLDTQASVLLALNQPEEAIKKLEDAVQQLPTGPRYFHLTQALDKAGRRDAAKEAWIKATKELLLNENLLHPLERADYQKFNTELAPEKG
jgi:tetratricopeptide (TPR) repeat protein